VSLKEIDLSWNGFETIHSADLGNVLVANNTLVELNLNNNRICHVGAQNLAKGLSKNESLSCLRIKGNSIKEEGFLAIMQAIRDNHRSCVEIFEHPKIDFPSKETLEIIEEVMSKSSSETNLSLQC